MTYELGEVMALGTAIFLIATGAILRYAVTATFAGIDLAVVGLVLMWTGVLGLVLSLVFMLRSNHQHVQSGGGNPNPTAMAQGMDDPHKPGPEFGGPPSRGGY